MSEIQTVKGFKVFNPDWTCRGKQYACPGTFEEDVIPDVCEQGMHFCKKAMDCFNYYYFNPVNKVAEVIAYGTVVEKGDKCCTDRLEIIREISWTELLELVNTGKFCSGYGNTGNWNTGNWNTGNRNTGSRNTGNWNTGNWNTGDCNTGSWNSGKWNTGNWNTGNWNSANGCNGCFNTIDPPVFMFNRSSDWTHHDWINSEAHRLLLRIVSNHVKWIPFSKMSDEEKQKRPEAETTDGYLKTFSKKEQAELSTQNWHKLTDDEKRIILSLPNFDKEIFKQTTGIDVDSKPE